jgi:hypothetical protein
MSVPALRRAGETTGVSGTFGVSGVSGGGMTACSTGRGGVGRTISERWTIGIGSVGVVPVMMRSIDAD